MITSSAIALMLATPALATSVDTHKDTTTMTTTATQMETSIFLEKAQVNDMFANELIGKSLYAADRDATGANKTALDQDWDNVGEINDLLLGGDGEVKAVLLDIGGFLGLGEKTIAMDMSELTFIPDEGAADDYFVTVALSREALEAAAEFTPIDSDEPAMSMDHLTMGTAWDRPSTQREGYVEVMGADVIAADLQGAPIYGANDERLGEVEELVINEAGKVEAAFVDIGGFLGMGEHRIAMSYDELQIMKDADGDDLHIFVSATQEQLEGRPADAHLDDKVAK
jgi:hypothetical protein